jgi:structural maintenance of chromosome 4
MSGGGTRVAKGGMSSKQVAEVSKAQVSKLEFDRDEMEKKFQTFQEKQRQLEVSLKGKKDEIPKLQTLIQKIHLEIESTNRNILDAQRRLKELTEEHRPSKSDDNRSAILEKHIGMLEQEIEKLRAETAGVEEEIHSLQNRIMEIGGVRLRTQKARVDGLKEQIGLLTEEISNAEVAKSKNEKLQAKHEKSRADAEMELEHVCDEMVKLNDDIDNQASNMSGSRQKVEEAQQVGIMRDNMGEMQTNEPSS